MLMVSMQGANPCPSLTLKGKQMSNIKKSSRGRLPDGAPNPIDVHVGNRIRLRRQLLGLSQEKLAEMLGLTFQQVQKYERGMNRVGASRLWDIGKVLEVPVGFFYEDMDEETAKSSPAGINGVIDNEPMKESVDPMNSQETIELVKAYYKIPNRKAAKHMFELIIAMSKSTYKTEDGEQHVSGI